MGADDEVVSRIHQVVRRAALVGARREVVLPAPVYHRDDESGTARARLRHMLAEERLPVRAVVAAPVLEIQRVDRQVSRRPPRLPGRVEIGVGGHRVGAKGEPHALDVHQHGIGIEAVRRSPPFPPALRPRPRTASSVRRSPSRPRSWAWLLAVWSDIESRLGDRVQMRGGPVEPHGTEVGAHRQRRVHRKFQVPDGQVQRAKVRRHERVGAAEIVVPLLAGAA